MGSCTDRFWMKIFQLAWSIMVKILLTLFVFKAIPIKDNTQETAKLSKETPQIVLWHHRLAHTSYTTLETMKRLHTDNGYYPDVHSGPMPQCISCPFGQHIRSLFQHTEKIPTNMRD